jgi:hypothetical protein
MPVRMHITPQPTDDEAAAIAAALALIERSGATGPASRRPDDTLHVWVDASRRSAQRAGLQRGPWRLSGRIARRTRA